MGQKNSNTIPGIDAADIFTDEVKALFTSGYIEDMPAAIERMYEDAFLYGGPGAMDRDTAMQYYADEQRLLIVSLYRMVRGLCVILERYDWSEETVIMEQEDADEIADLFNDDMHEDSRHAKIECLNDMYHTSAIFKYIDGAAMPHAQAVHDLFWGYTYIKQVLQGYQTRAQRGLSQQKRKRA